MQGAGKAATHTIAPEMEGRVQSCTGWGRTAKAMVPVVAPATQKQIERVFEAHASERFLPIGNGRSYGDNGITSTGVAISSARLDAIHSFDEVTGELVCDAGVTYRDLIQRFLPVGFVAPVSPGTSYVTIGGAIANDVHGKNHDRAGSLGHHVNWVDVVCPDGVTRRASRNSNRWLFEATVGGIGLTGVISRVSLTLSQLDGDAVAVKEARIRDLDEFLDQLFIARESSQYSVGWIDVLKKGAEMGRGILETAEPASEYLRQPVPRRLQVPIDFPNGVFNRQTVSLFNAVYLRRVPKDGRQSVVPYDRFTYPLDAIGHWNRFFGSKGFYQFQCVLPDAESRTGIRKLLEILSAAGCATFLAVLKTLGPNGLGHLSFPMQGCTLAVDIPRRAGALDVLRRLEVVTLNHGGRVYLAKDAALSPQGFRRMYPHYEKFIHVLERIDPAGRMQSDMALRLKLRNR